jgi:hypothetical protein
MRAGYPRQAVEQVMHLEHSRVDEVTLHACVYGWRGPNAGAWPHR